MQRAFDVVIREIMICIVPSLIINSSIEYGFCSTYSLIRFLRVLTRDSVVTSRLASNDFTW